MALLQGISNEALALSLFVDGVASRLPVSFTLANVSQDPSACSFLRLVSPPQLPLVVGELLEPGPVFQAVNYAGQPTAGVIVALLAEVSGQVTAFNTFAVTNASGHATLTNASISSGFTQVVTLYAVGLQDQGFCIGDLIRVQLINPVAAVRLTSLAPVQEANSTTVDFAIEFEAVDGEGQPESGLTADVILLSKPNYLADWSNEQLFRFGQSANTSAAQLSLGKGYPGDYAFALKVAGEPGPIFNITVPNHVASLQITTQPISSRSTDVARLGQPFAVQPIVRVLDAQGNGVSGVVVECEVCNNGDKAYVGSVNSTTAIAASPYSAPSDALGYANFSSLGFVGATPGTYELCFTFAKGEAFQVGPVGPSAALKSVDTMQVVVVQQPSSTTSVGVPLAAPPIIQVYAIRTPVGPDGNFTAGGLSPRHQMALSAISAAGIAAAGTTTAAASAEEPAPGARDLLNVMVGVITVDGLFTRRGVLANPVAVTANGNLTFAQLTLQLGLSSYTYLQAKVVGGAATLPLQINPIEVVDTPSRITVQQSPPVSVYVGQSFSMSVLVTISSGSPLAAHMVEAFLDKTPENSHARLDETTISNVTDNNGIARFHLILATGIPGNYSLRFRSVGGSAVVSDSTAAFRVLNIVERVEVVTQPEGQALISENRNRAINSLRQPRLRVVDDTGKGLPGRTVQVLTAPPDAALLYNRSHLTDDNGYYQFTDLRFIDGTSQDYQLVFVCEGIDSLSQSFSVYNELEPDQSNLKYLSYFVYISMVIVLPFFFANSGWVRQKHASFGFLLLGLLLLLAMIAAALGIIINGYQVGQFDPYLQTLRLFFFVVLLLPIIPYTVVFVLFALKKTSFFHYRARKDMFHRHTCQLFQSPRALGIPVSAVEKEAVVRQREAFLRSLSWKARLWAMIRNLHKDYSNWHAPLEGWDSFFYPQRFVIGISLGLMILFYVFVGATVLIYYVIYLLVHSYNRLISLEVIALQKGGGLMSGNSEVFADLWAAVVSLLVRVSVNIDNNVVSRLRDQIFATGLSAALISLALCLFILVHYCRSYRRQIMRMRQGIYPEDRNQYGIPGATSFIGTLMNHTAAGFLAVFVLLWLALFLCNNDVFRKLIWENLVESWLLKKFLTASFIISICLFLFRFIVVGRILLAPRGAIRHRRWFAVADYVNTFLSALGGLISVAIRLVTAIGFMLISFVRLDTPAIGSYSAMDPGYSSWIGLLVSDARYNNPVANVFADLMIARLVALRKRRSGHQRRGGKEVEVEVEAGAESESLLEPGRLGVPSYTTLERLGDSRLEFSEEGENRGNDDDDDDNSGGGEEALDRRTRARNRWFLFYTLIKNPQLRTLRRRADDHKLHARGPSDE